MSGDRVLAIYGVIFALIGGLGILFFWLIGAILLLTGNGGTITDLPLGDTGRVLFLAYPAVMLACAVLAILLLWGRRDREALLLAGLPVVGTVLFYLAVTVPI